MGRPRKVVEQPEGTEAAEVAEVAKATPKVELSKGEIAARTLEAKKAALAKEEKELSDNLKKISEDFMAGTQAPLFVPYKDRDGKTVPALVLGLFQTEKRDPKTQELILTKDREVQLSVKASVWVFSNMSEPHRAVYHLPNA